MREVYRRLHGRFGVVLSWMERLFFLMLVIWPVFPERSISIRAGERNLFNRSFLESFLLQDFVVQCICLSLAVIVVRLYLNCTANLLLRRLRAPGIGKTVCFRCSVESGYLKRWDGDWLALD